LDLDQLRHVDQTLLRRLQTLGPNEILACANRQAFHND
jgi:hypothetical protein